MQIISYYQVICITTKCEYDGSLRSAYHDNFFIANLGLNSQELFKFEGNRKVIQQLVSLYNQGIVCKIIEISSLYPVHSVIGVCSS